MPIRFACEHCNSTLSVSSRKAGHQVMCPKCRQPTPVPTPTAAAVATASEERLAEKSAASTSTATKTASIERPLAKAPAPPVAPITVTPPVEESPPPAAPITITPPAEEVAATAAARTIAPPEKDGSPPAPAVTITPPIEKPAPVEKAAPIELPTIEPIKPSAPQNDSILIPITPDSISDNPLAAEEDDSDEVTWVYEGSRQTTYEPGDTDFDRISLPRYVLYGQGVLLIVVAIVALTLGVLIGRGTAPRMVEKSGAPKPCYLTGIVTYKSSGGADLPDEGAVIVVVPENRRLAEKAPVEGLRPDDPIPDADQPGISRLKSIGGDYFRADEQGYFKLRVPDTGDYFLLVISRHARRKASERLDTVHLAQIGRYFVPAPDLLGDRQYRWRQETIKRDKEYKFTFE